MSDAMLTMLKSAFKSPWIWSVIVVLVVLLAIIAIREIQNIFK